MKSFIILFFFFSFFIAKTTASECTYVPFNNDPTTWGLGYCQTSADCSGVGTCILKECYCPPERAAPNCQYIRYSAQLQGWLMIGLSPIGLGCISTFMINLIGQGIGQLLLYIIGIAMVIIGIKKFASCGKLTGTCYTVMFVGTGCVLIIVSITWQITLGVLILTCHGRDGNGYALY